MAFDEVAVWVLISIVSVILSGVAFAAGERNRKREKKKTQRLWLQNREILCRLAVSKMEEYSEWCAEMRNINPHLHFPLLLLQAHLPSNDVRRIKEAELYRDIAAGYWDSVVEMFQKKELDDGFFDAINLDKWEKYRNVGEALDIANLYGMGVDGKRGEYFLEGNRPERYRLIEEIWLNSLRGDGEERVKNEGWWKEQRWSVCQQVKGVRERLRERPSEMHIEIGESSSAGVYL